MTARDIARAINAEAARLDGKHGGLHCIIVDGVAYAVPHRRVRVTGVDESGRPTGYSYGALKRVSEADVPSRRTGRATQCGCTMCVGARGAL